MNPLLLLALLANASEIEDTKSVDSCDATAVIAPSNQSIAQTLAASSAMSLINSSANPFISQSTEIVFTEVKHVSSSQTHENVFQYETQQAFLSNTSHSYVLHKSRNDMAPNSSSILSFHTGLSSLGPSINPIVFGSESPEVISFLQMNKSDNSSNISDSGRNQDTLLGNTSKSGRFMSFEEWKKQKELEIEAVSGDAEVSSPSRSIRSTSLQPEEKKIHGTSAIGNDSLLLHEDQGRTYKDKFNYASVDCAATVVKTNSDAKGASAILTEVKDSYLINQCSTPNKFIVVELCQDVLISSIVMGNFELFSSMFRTVRFSVSDRFPAVDGWHQLGQFEAQNRRDVQSFSIENPLIWSRYLKIDILSHYGNEFYCPLSILRVHGTNMMEDFKNTESTNKAELQTSSPTEEFLNYTVDFDDECKALSPYLTMNKFLEVFNSSSEFCGIKSNNSGTSSGSTPTKATQDSIFQNIIKRLSLLESNATLSLLYVQEQSKLLSDAFTSLEARQVKKFEGLLMQFNENIHSQVQFLEASLQKINDESKKVLQTSRVFTSGAVKRIKMETTALGSELNFLKKLVVIDTIIIISLLAYVVFREAFVAEDLLKKENAAGIKRSPMKAFSVSKRKANFKRRR